MDSPSHLPRPPPQGLDFPHQLLGQSQSSGSPERGLPSVVSAAGASSPSPSPCSSHAVRFGHLINSPFLSDVDLLVGPPGIAEGAGGGELRRVKAHRVILGAISPVFHTMFGDPAYMESRAATIAVPYNLDRCFQAVLEFIYRGSVTSEFDACLLLDAACFYELDELKDMAIEVLRRETTIESSLDMLEVALRYTAPPLREHCITLIRQHNPYLLQTPQWLQLSLEVAVLLVQETIIESELVLLQRCLTWCEHHVDACTEAGDSSGSGSETSKAQSSDPELPEGQREGQKGRDHQRSAAIQQLMLRFLAFIDFTAMTEEEIAVVEAMDAVPLDCLYRAFKNNCLGLPPPHAPRKGGIILQWEMSADRDVEVVSNHVRKISQDYVPKTVCAVNRFSKGHHYWTYSILDLRSPHDCLVGVLHRGLDRAYLFEPCSMSISSPPGTKVTKEPTAFSSILVDHCCVVGLLLDFDANCIRWFNHQTKKLLFTAEPTADDAGGGEGEGVDGDDPHGDAEMLRVRRGLLPTPLVPATTLYHKSNGGVALSETTTFPEERLSFRKPINGGLSAGGQASTPNAAASFHRGGLTPKKQRSFQ